MSMKQPEFSHHIKNGGNVTIVTLRGHLNGFAAKGLRPEIDQILDRGARSIVFDCRELSYIGLIGYTIVLTSARKMQRRKRRFALCNLAPDLKEIFQRAGMMNLDILIFDSLDML